MVVEKKILAQRSKMKLSLPLGIDDAGLLHECDWTAQPLPASNHVNRGYIKQTGSPLALRPIPPPF